MNILVLNVGSSSVKATLFRPGTDEPSPSLPPPAWQAHVDLHRSGGMAEMRVESTGGEEVNERIAVDLAPAAVEALLPRLWKGSTRVLSGPEEVNVVGHRVVHGGESFVDAVWITPEVKAEIARLCEFAPEHNGPQHAAIEVVERVLGGNSRHVAVFDTTFHGTLPKAAAAYAGPYDWWNQGIRRYGFHGINHQYVSRRAAEMTGQPIESLRIVTCHLGSGASLAAIQGGRSIDTTMGFTPLEGLMMSRRSGSVDPGLLIYLLRRRGHTTDQLDTLLNEESGLKGISGGSGDMRDVIASRERGDERARLAFDMYVHRLSRGIGAMVAVLGGLDILVFTGGIGENCPQLREVVCRQLAFLDLHLSPAANTNWSQNADIASPDSRARVLVLKAREDEEIARECLRLVQNH